MPGQVQPLFSIVLQFNGPLKYETRMLRNELKIFSFYYDAVVWRLRTYSSQVVRMIDEPKANRFRRHHHSSSTENSKEVPTARSFTDILVSRVSSRKAVLFEN